MIIGKDYNNEDILTRSDQKISERTMNYMRNDQVSDNEPKDIFEMIFTYIIASLAFLFPIFILPFLGNPLLGSKLILLVVYAVILCILTIIKIVAQKKISWGRSSFDIPIFVLILAVSIATIFSSSISLSIFGNYGSFFPSLITIFAFGIIYFAIVAHIKRQSFLELIKKVFIVSIIIVSFVAILNYFGIYIIPLDIAKNRNFNLIGSNEMVSFLAILTSLQLFLYYMKETNMSRKVLYLAPLAILIPAGVIFGGLASLAAAVSGLLITIYLGNQKIERKSVIAFSVLLIVALSFGLIAKYALKNDEYLDNVKLNPAVSWVISTSAIRDYPVGGTGLGTFSNSFTKYKPASFSSTEMSGLRFNYPYSEYMLYMSEVGLIGLIALIFIVFSVIRKVKTVREYRETGEEDSFFVTADYIVMASLIIGLLFIALNLTAFLFFIIILATLGVEINKIENLDPINGENEEENLSISQELMFKSSSVSKYIVLLYMFMVMVGGIYFLTKFSIADVSYKVATDAARKNDVVKTVKYFDRAARSFRYYDTYLRDYSVINILIANSITLDDQGEAKTELNEQEQAEVQKRYKLALALINDAININPQNSLNYATRGDLFNSTIGKTEDQTSAGNNTLSSYASAETYDPNNLDLKMKIGSLYYAFKDYQKAGQYFLAAVNLNPNYANGYYNLAFSLKNLKDYTNAVSAMNNVLLLTNQDSEDYKKAKEELDALKVLVEENKDKQEQTDLNVKPVEDNAAKSTKTNTKNQNLTDPTQ